METTTENPNENKINIFSFSMRYGLILGLILVFYNLMLYLTKLYLNQGMGMAGMIIWIIMIVYAHNQFKKEQGYMSFGQGVGIATLVIMAGSLLAAIFQVIYMNVIDPSMLDHIMAYAEAQMEAQGQTMTDEDMEMAMSITKMMFSPISLMLIGLIGGAIWGAILGLIVSIFTKKSPPQPFAQ